MLILGINHAPSSSMLTNDGMLCILGIYRHTTIGANDHEYGGKADKVVLSWRVSRLNLASLRAEKAVIAIEG